MPLLILILFCACISRPSHKRLVSDELAPAHAGPVSHLCLSSQGECLIMSYTSEYVILCPANFLLPLTASGSLLPGQLHSNLIKYFNTTKCHSHLQSKHSFQRFYYIFFFNFVENLDVHLESGKKRLCIV